MRNQIVNNALGPLLQEAETNQTIRHMYAKKNCRQCLGRGINKTSTPTPNTFGKTTQFVDKDRLCDCVIKTIKREL